MISVAPSGVFFGVVSGVARPFREAGIDVRDELPEDAPAGVARFDGNPERLRVDSQALGLGGLDVAGTARAPVVVGTWESTMSPPEIVRIDPANGRRTALTRFNADRVAAIDWQPVREFCRLFYGVWNLSWALDTQWEADVFQAAEVVGIA